MEKIRLASFPNNSILLTCFDKDYVNDIEKILHIKLEKQFYWQTWLYGYNLNDLTNTIITVFNDISDQWGKGKTTMRSFN